MRHWSAMLVGALLCSSAQAGPAEPAGPCRQGAVPLLVLGTFHMEGGTEDAASLRFDDMRAPRRQAEIEALVDRLARFRPSKVAIESSRISSYWNERYAAWRAGQHPLGINEIEQIGFRLAGRMNLPALSPVDYPMWMNGLTAIDRHEPKPSPAVTSAAAPESALMTQVHAQLALDEARLRAGTVGEYLAYLNSPGRLLTSHRWDVISNLVPGDGVALYENTDLATHWYKRNLRIYTNLVAVTVPDDRVLLLIGAGHGHLLRTLAAEDPRYCLADVAEYVR